MEHHVIKLILLKMKSTEKEMANKKFFGIPVLCSLTSLFFIFLLLSFLCYMLVKLCFYFITQTELNGPGQKIGYRRMHQYLRQKYNLRVKRYICDCF